MFFVLCALLWLWILSCSLFVGCCYLLVVMRLWLSVVCCSLIVFRCLWCVVCCVLFVVRRSLIVVGCWLFDVFVAVSCRLLLFVVAVCC